jgi:uncharacterized membrane protein
MIDFPAFFDFINYVSLILVMIGSAIIIYGAAKASVNIIARGLRRIPDSEMHIRGQFSQKIIFGLDFFIAADILTSVVTPNLNDLTLLALVVGIRTVLSYFLSREIKEIGAN